MFETYLPWIAQSVQRLWKCRTILGSNPGEGEFSPAVQTGAESHAASYSTSNGSFPGATRKKGGVLPPTPF